jgi:hypothetical protein
MPTDPTQTAPERNRYFYGLMMDAERFNRDQAYFNGKRQLLNRFVSGAGVVRGLGLTFDSTTKALTLQPGLGIDFAGREIVVPAAVPVDLTNATDSQGKPTGSIPAGSTVLLSLAYAEQAIDPVPVLVPDCENPGSCAPCTTEEGFVVLVVATTTPAPAPYDCSGGSFPLPPGAALKTAIAVDLALDYSAAPADTSIPLGRFTLPDGPLDAVSDRAIVYDNTLLYRMIVCLAQQVSKGLSDTLMYVSGDNQTATADQALANPLVVSLVDSTGKPITGGSPPTFTVTQGGGSFGAVTNPSPGQYEAVWTLGAAGPQTATAQSTQSNLTVTFNATAQ